jgi:type IX secretion system PorP/SprF family membrane protein
MVKQLTGVIVLVSFLIVGIDGQESGYGPGYQTIVMTNPAFAGTEGDGILRLSYLNYYPGKNYNLHSVFVSYDTYMTGLHGGAGLFLSDDYLGGIVNNMRGGFSYSYHLQADKNIFINAGLSGSFYHTGIDRSNIILPDQIDPLNGVVYSSAESLNIRGRTVFDIGTGFMLIAGRYTAGLALNHLAKPDISGDGSAEGRLNRKLSMNFSGTFEINKKLMIAVKPVIFSEIQGSRMTAAIGGSLETIHFSINAMLLTNRAKDLNIQTGFFLKKGSLIVFYNYCFNIVSKNNLLPLSLLHQAGLAFSLNNVDKRKIIKTINFPNL